MEERHCPQRRILDLVGDGLQNSCCNAALDSLHCILVLGLFGVDLSGFPRISFMFSCMGC